MRHTLACSKLLGKWIWFLTQVALRSAMIRKMVHYFTCITKTTCSYGHQKYL
jgi:hypothetical protein